MEPTIFDLIQPSSSFAIDASRQQSGDAHEQSGDDESPPLQRNGSVRNKEPVPARTQADLQTDTSALSDAPLSTTTSEQANQDAPHHTTELQPNKNRQDQERGEYLEKEITTLAAHIHAATWRLLELIREYDETMAWSGPGLASVAHWLNWKCGMNLGAARERVRVAHALPDLPMISEKLRLGEISYSKVRAMTRVATAENEDFMLMIARHGTAAHVERVVRNFRKVKRIEALELDNERHYQRKLDWFYDDDGYLVLKGRFTPEAGAVVVKALQLAKDHLFLESKDVSADMLIRLPSVDTRCSVFT